MTGDYSHPDPNYTRPEDSEAISSYTDLLSTENFMPEIEERVKTQECKKYNDAYRACAVRISKSDDTSKHCSGWYWDLYTCIGKNSSTEIFSRLR